MDCHRQHPGRSGRLDGNKLRVQWRTVEGLKPASGVTTYTITTKRELHGERAVTGLLKIGTEDAFPNPEGKSRQLGAPWLLRLKSASGRGDGNRDGSGSRRHARQQIVYFSVCK
jgi:hypothetical protein